MCSIVFVCMWIYLIYPQWVGAVIRLVFCCIVLPHVGHISWDVELCTWVKVLLRAGYRWTQSLVLHSVMEK